MNDYLMNKYYEDFMNPNDYSKLYRKAYGLTPPQDIPYGELSTYAKSIFGTGNDPRLQQLSQMLSLYQQGLQ